MRDFGKKLRCSFFLVWLCGAAASPPSPPPSPSSPYEELIAELENGTTRSGSASWQAWDEALRARVLRSADLSTWRRWHDLTWRFDNTLDAHAAYAALATARESSRYAAGTEDYEFGSPPTLGELLPTELGVGPRATATSVASLAFVVEVERALASLQGGTLDSYDLIVEWGGGSATLAYVLIRRLNWRGTYVVVDLPALSALQRCVSRTLGLEIVCVSGVEQIPATAGSKRLFLSKYALSETPLAERLELLESPVAGFDAFAVVHNTPIPEFEGNRDFFRTTFRDAVEARDCPTFFYNNDAAAAAAARECASKAYGETTVVWREARYLPTTRTPASWLLVGVRQPVRLHGMRGLVLRARCRRRDADVDRFLAHIALPPTAANLTSIRASALVLATRVCDNHHDCATIFVEVDDGTYDVRLSAEPCARARARR